MAETDTVKFDVYDDKGAKVVEAQPSPIVLKGLTSSTTYKGYQLTYADKETKTALADIVTKASAKVAVTGVTLDTMTLTLGVGDSATLTPTVAPDNATDKTGAWTTSDSKIVTVADGKVTRVAEGDATVTFTTTDGAKVAAATIKTASPEVAKIDTTDTTATITVE
ncbi:Ig-like domain-containing protein [Secundilactobacillus kimchicus]|uniref:Ig-like domain-containing protein n=1 Tax=Secundilactobacillus kimchicus TaxID=528209 RepID=UPI0024A8496E|nr:Ig-like domain-containing protein [Secundilactobacillus kimchicus]